MHKAVIFDLGRVLINFDFKRGYRALEGPLPVPPRPRFPGAWRRTGLVERFETGLIEPRDFVAQMCSRARSQDRLRPLLPRLDLDLHRDADSRERCSPAWRRATICCCFPIPTPSTSRGCAPVIHSSCAISTSLILSYEVKAMKPEPEIYQAAIARAGCRRRRVLLYRRYRPAFVTAARSLGIDGVSSNRRRSCKGK